jgi:hypothetical protein
MPQPLSWPALIREQAIASSANRKLRAVNRLLFDSMPYPMNSKPEAAPVGQGDGSQSTVCFGKLPRLKTSAQNAQTDATRSLELAAIARRVCWWEPASNTLENTPVFLCRIMVLGTWDDTCIAIEHYGRNAFREALQNAPPGLFDPRSWHYWHHRLEFLPVPPLPQRGIQT